MGIEFSESGSRLFFYLVFLISALNAGVAANQQKNNKFVGRIFLLLSFFVLFIPLGMRKGGIDHDVYMEWYDHADFWLKTNYHMTPEPLFAWLTILAKDYLGEFQIIYLFSSFVYLAGVFAFLRKYNGFGYISVFFMSFSLYLYMCGLARISIAIGIVSYAFTMLEKKKKSLILILVACMFHYTAIIALLVYSSYKSKKNISFKNVLYILVGFSMLAYIINKFSSSLPYVLYRYAQYMKFSFNIRYISTVIILLPAIVFWIVFKRGFKRIYADKYIFYDNVIKVIFALMVLSILFDGVFRITFFYYPFVAKIYIDLRKVLKSSGQEAITPFYTGIFSIVGMIYVHAVFFTSPFITPYIIPFRM